MNYEKTYLFNPFDIKDWSAEMIEKQVYALIEKYDGKNDTMYGLAHNIEVLANINYLYGEMMARLQERRDEIKRNADIKEAEIMVEERATWLRTNQDKPPAMRYFEAKAEKQTLEQRSRQDKYDADLIRFKKAYENTESKMNALKKRMEAIKYEEFNQ